MRTILLLLLAALLSSCALKKAEVKSPVGVVTLPPVISDYSKDTLTKDAILRYTDDMNWYTNYLFAYVKNLNRYAGTIGWEPPNTHPICRLMDLPQLEPFPPFVRKRGEGQNDFEWDLSNFIRDLKIRHNNDVEVMRSAVIYQRGLCTY